MGVVQIDHQGGDRLAERRTGFQTGRGGRAHPLATAGATAAEQPHPGHVRLDGRQLDAVVDLLRGLLLYRQDGRAMRADVELGIDDAIRLRVQHPPNAAAARTRWLGAGRPLRLLPLRRRQRGIVRRLAWMFKHGKPSFKDGVARLQRSNPHQRGLKLANQRQQR
jgi:hypothetical protein